MARPKKYDIDPEEVIKLAGYGCSQRDIADFYGCDESLISKNYSSIFTKARAEMKNGLRSKQINVAMGGNVTMLIWLGKQILGQSEKVEASFKDSPNGFELEEI
jgi:DNA-binding CsgD family transcriptional regulator